MKKGVKILSDSALVYGFGALHGSGKTEDVEVMLIQSLAEQHKLKYYFPETDYSTAAYFQKYIETGNEDLLYSLVKAYAERVPQEGSVEVYEKWKKLRPIFIKHQVQIIGVDKIANYQFSMLQMEDQLQTSTWVYKDILKNLLATSKSFSAYYSDSLKHTLKQLVESYEMNQDVILKEVKDSQVFKHIIKNIKYTFAWNDRETILFDNYKALNQSLNFKNAYQFVRMGLFHIMKGRMNRKATFFAQLIESGMYTKAQVMTIQGYLSDSEVLWYTNYYPNGDYKNYSTKGDAGISDHIFEHFQGIKYLKKTALSDMTYFNLNADGSPYSEAKNLSLLNVKKRFGSANWHPDATKATTDYIDAAVLILQSEAGYPIETLRVR
ncbi:MAG: hypothetical protein R2852_02945 [Bacteroidia bacterium]